jgi:spore germination protein YaaH
MDHFVFSSVVDIFEVMAYDQILRRSPEWPAAIGADIKRRTEYAIICAQAKELYLEGMYAGLNPN